MSWITLRPQVKAVIDTVPNMQEVSLAPKLKFSGYPAAYVVPSSNEADYETTSENVRTYAFRVVFFYETKIKGIDDALTSLETIIDNALDAFDQQDLKSSTTRLIGVSLPADYTFLNVWAVPASWGQLINEELIMAELLVRVRVSVDVTS